MKRLINKQYLNQTTKIFNRDLPLEKNKSCSKVTQKLLCGQNKSEKLCRALKSPPTSKELKTFSEVCLFLAMFASLLVGVLDNAVVSPAVHSDACYSVLWTILREKYCMWENQLTRLEPTIFWPQHLICDVSKKEITMSHITRRKTPFWMSSILRQTGNIFYPLWWFIQLTGVKRTTWGSERTCNPPIWCFHI